MAITAYVVGQWVRAENFYGRETIIHDIFHGNRNSMWILGTRRIGKTSLLKQLEYLTTKSPELGYFPLFWDFQGAEEPADLLESFGDSLLDCIDRLDDLGISLEEIETDDLFTSISRLRRQLKKKKMTLLLLGDEVEELVEINEKEPKFLRRLRRSLQSAENIRTVLASKIKLWDLAYKETSTSPFLHGFTPPLYVLGLSDDAARALIRQTQLPPDSQPELDPETVEIIRKRCNNHPYLLQILSERYTELQDLDRAIEEIATDQMVSHFFAVDFEMLTSAEHEIIALINSQGEATTNSIRVKLALSESVLTANLRRLEHLGFIHSGAEKKYSLTNYFFKRWLTNLPGLKEQSKSSSSRQSTISEAALDTANIDGVKRLGDNRYELLESVGEGATGQVYKAFDTMLQSMVAVKVLKQEHLDQAEGLERLRREVLLSRNLSHPNLLKIYHLGDDHGLKFIIMQYIEGQNFSDVLDSEAPLSVQRTISLAQKITSALAAAHREKVLHRDIKPSNILIDLNGEPLITDFGLARLQDGPNVTRDGCFVGTPTYASPEQIMGRAVDDRSDLYSFGVVLFEMITGSKPFSGDSVLMDHLNTSPPDPRDIREDVPDSLAKLILRCLEKDPSSRFQSAELLVTALHNLE